MPKATVAMVAQHTANLPSSVIVINHKRLIRATDYALMRSCFDVRQMLISYEITKFSAIVGISVRSTARATPTVQPVSLFIMRREELCCAGFFRLTASAS